MVCKASYPPRVTLSNVKHPDCKISNKACLYVAAAQDATHWTGVPSHGDEIIPSPSMEATCCVPVVHILLANIRASVQSDVLRELREKYPRRFRVTKKEWQRNHCQMMGQILKLAEKVEVLTKTCDKLLAKLNDELLFGEPVSEDSESSSTEGDELYETFLQILAGCRQNREGGAVSTDDLG